MTRYERLGAGQVLTGPARRGEKRRRDRAVAVHAVWTVCLLPADASARRSYDPARRYTTCWFQRNVITSALRSMRRLACQMAYQATAGGPHESELCDEGERATLTKDCQAISKAELQYPEWLERPPREESADAHAEQNECDVSVHHRNSQEQSAVSAKVFQVPSPRS